MKNEYPKGAIQTVEQLRALGRNAVIFAASCAYSCGVTEAIELSGATGVKTHADGGEYHFFEVIYRHSNGDFNFSDTRSLLDANIPFNGYNDWFVFVKEEDARAYLDAEPMPRRGFSEVEA